MEARDNSNSQEDDDNNVGKPSRPASDDDEMEDLSDDEDNQKKKNKIKQTIEDYKNSNPEKYGTRKQYYQKIANSDVLS